jgi:hypothetical protein
MVIVTPALSILDTLPIMRADCRDAIGQLADGGDDCAEPGLEWRAGTARLGSW